MKWGAVPVWRVGLLFPFIRRVGLGDPRVFRADSGHLSFEGRFRVYFSRGQGRPAQLNGVKMGSRGGDDGRGANFSGYKHQGHLWVRTARAELIARASLSILRAQPAPRQVRLAEGSDISGHGDGVSRILNISRNYFGGGICVDATVLPRVKSRKKYGSDSLRAQRSCPGSLSG